MNATETRTEAKLARALELLAKRLDGPPGAVCDNCTAGQRAEARQAGTDSKTAMNPHPSCLACWRDYVEVTA